MIVIALLIFISIAQLFISIGMLIESRRTKNPAQKVFLAVATSFLLWTISLILVTFVDSKYNQGNIRLFNIANSFGYSLGSVSLLMVYLFNLYYPIKKQRKTRHKVAFLLGLSLSIISLTKYISGEFTIDSTGKLNYSTGQLSMLFVIFAVYILGSVVISSTYTIRHTTDLLLKRQVRTMLLGLSLTVVHAILFIVILAPTLDNSVTLYALGYLAPYYYIGFTVHSLVNQKLFDIKLIVARAAGYILTLLTVGSLYSLIVFVILAGFLGIANITILQRLIYAFLAVGFGVSLPFLKNFFDKLTNRFFYRDAYDAQNLLDELNKTLVGNIDLQPLLRESSSIIGTTLKAEFCTFIIRETDETSRRVIGNGNKKINDDAILALTTNKKAGTQMIVADEIEASSSEVKQVMSANDISIMARLATTGTVRMDQGYLVLGAKQSGNPYNKQDLQILDIIANELVIAIQNALRFEEIESFNITLQQKVNDATRQLRSTNEKLKALDETKDEFISMASHQLRTPLTSVKGYLSMVVEGDAGKLNKQQKDLLGQAFASSQRMVYLIADLLNVSRLRTGKFVIENKPTQLAEVIESEMNQLTETAKTKQQTLTYTKPDKFPELMLDETKIRQVIMNFTDNALHYTQSGGHIQVKLEDKVDSIEFTVVDDGLGVPKAEQHHLFTKFYRAGNAKKARPDGTGLGLFMAKKVIIAQGGAIIFQSEENKGSTFGFTFPKTNLKVASTKGAPKSLDEAIKK